MKIKKLFNGYIACNKHGIKKELYGSRIDSSFEGAEVHKVIMSEDEDVEVDDCIMSVRGRALVVSQDTDKVIFVNKNHLIATIE